MNLRIRQLIITMLGMSLIYAIAILVGIYPYRPKTGIIWIILFLVCPPIVLIGEGIGTILLENQFVAKLGRFPRMTYAVVIISLLIVGGIVLTNSNLFNNYFEPWGS